MVTDDIFPDHTADSRGPVLLAGRYLVVRELGRGAMGRVLLAEDTTLDGDLVAIKVPDVLLTQDEQAVARIKREARLAKDGAALITDFGIAREKKETLTRLTGRSTSGTLPYMSPEQVRGKRPAAAQDVYGLAATLYSAMNLSGSGGSRRG